MKADALTDTPQAPERELSRGDLSRQLRDVRKAAGLSPEGLARKLGWVPQYIEVLEMKPGVRPIPHSDPANLIEIAKKLGLPKHHFALAHFRTMWGKAANEALAAREAELRRALDAARAEAAELRATVARQQAVIASLTCGRVGSVDPLGGE